MKTKHHKAKSVPQRTLTATTLVRIEINDPHGFKRRMGSKYGTFFGYFAQFLRSNRITAVFTEVNEPGLSIAYYAQKDARKIKRWFSFHREETGWN